MGNAVSFPILSKIIPIFQSERLGGLQTTLYHNSRDYIHVHVACCIWLIESGTCITSVVIVGFSTDQKLQALFINGCSTETTSGPICNLYKD